LKSNVVTDSKPKNERTNAVTFRLLDHPLKWWLNIYWLTEQNI